MTDIVEPGTGDLLSYTAYSGDVATLLTFPSRTAYLTALLSDTWQAGLDARSAAVADAIVLVAGENTIPPMALAMFGEPRPASDFPAPNIDGKSPDQIVGELLTVYPDGGADPSRTQLEVMMHFPGFREQPVHYIMSTVRNNTPVVRLRWTDRDFVAMAADRSQRAPEPDRCS